MDFFAILEIGETTDEDIIRNAYRQKLSLVNPEDDQEGFMRLRDAYEQALAWARRPKEEAKPEGPIDLLLRRFEKVYGRMEVRTNPDEWKALLEDPLFHELDLEEGAKWSLFIWLADHWRLPDDIWRLLDRFFFIRENLEEFREHLPEGFVVYMESKLSENRQASDFPYDRFRVSAEAEAVDYDGYLANYDELRRLMGDDGNPEAAEQKIQYMETTGISHPWVLVEKARLLAKRGENQRAEELVRELLRTDGDDLQVFLSCARLLKALGFAQEAQPMFEKLLEREELPDGANYYSGVELAELYEREGRLAEARKLCLGAINLFETDEVLQMLRRLNEALIEKWTQTPESLETEEAVQLAWCFIQSERSQEGLDFVKAHNLLAEDHLKCYRAKAVLALETGHYEETISSCGSWRRKLEAQAKQDGSDAEAAGVGDERLSEEEYRDSLVQTWEIEGRALLKQAEQSTEQEAEALYQRAGAAFEQALALKPNELNIMMNQVMMLRAQNKYEDVTVLCERMKEIDSGFYWAYFYAQEAYWKLRKAQGVVDNFYEAKRIYAGHADIYERAAEVFLAFGHYRDAAEVLDSAKEEGVDSPRLRVQRINLLREQIEDEESARKADTYAQSVIAEMEEDKDAPADILAEAYLERVYIQGERDSASFRSADKLAEWARRSVQLNDTTDARYSLGRSLFLFDKNISEALEQLKVCEARGMTFCWMYYYIARCQEEFEEWDKAIEYYKKAMEAGPDEIDFAWRAAWLYRRKFARTGQRVYYDSALEYMKRQFEKCEADASDYWQMSDLHARVQKYETALEEIEHALETDKRARNWGHKAQLLEVMHRRREAVPFYEKGLEAEIEAGRDYAFAYSQMADYFCETKAYEEGIDWFLQWMPKVQTDEQRDENREHIKKLYIRLRRYDKALEMIKEIYGSTDLTGYCCDSWEDEGERIDDLLDVYQLYLSEDELKARAEEAVALLEGKEGEKLEESASGRFSAYKQIAYCWTNYILNDGRGRYYFGKALELLQSMGAEAEDSDYNEVLEELMACCHRQGDLTAAKHYREMFMERLAKRYEECSGLELSVLQMHENSCNMRRHNLYQLFLCSYFTGDYETARRYVEEMAESPWCSYCAHSDCTELWECRGYIALLDGDSEKAEEYFARAEECGTRGNSDAEAELRRLKSKQ